MLRTWTWTPALVAFVLFADGSGASAATAEASAELPAAAVTGLPPDAEEAEATLAASPRHGEWVDVERPDGSPLTTWVVYPERAEKAGAVIVIHEIFGLTDWIRAVADRLAADGFIALAPDLLSGKAPDGGGTAALGESVREVIRTLSPEEVHAGLDAVREYAVGLPAANGRVGTVGFCWGGSTSFAYAAAQRELDAAVVYYGSSPGDPADYERVQAPVLGIYAGDDERVNATIPMAREAMDRLGKSYAVHVYGGSGHGFLRQQTGRDGANRGASEQAWPETIAFFREHLE